MNFLMRFVWVQFVFLFLLSHVFALSPQLLKTPDTLNVCSYSEFKPISFSNGQGYEADLLRAIAKLWKVKIAFHPQKTYEGIWLAPSKKNSQCDLAAGGITPADYRIAQGATFSIDTTYFNQSLLIRKKDFSSGRITSYCSFRNTPMKIGVVPGTTGERYAILRAKALKLPLSIFVQYESESSLLPALLSQKIDAIARGEIGNEYQAAMNKNLITIAKKDFNEGFTFALDHSNQLLLEKLNAAIRVLTDNGKINYEQWLNNQNIFMERVALITK